MTYVKLMISWALWSGVALAQLTFDTMVVDFGKVWRGQKLHRDISFFNAGSRPLRMEAIDSGCGCVAVEREIGKLYGPQEIGSIRIKLDTENYRGKLERRIGILTGPGAIKYLRVKAQIMESFLVEPTVVDFGQLASSAGERRSLTLKFLNKKTILIKAIKNHLDFAMVSNNLVTGQVEVRLHDPLPRGKYSGFFILETDDPYHREVTVPVFLTLGSEMVRGAGYLEFGSIAKGQSVERSLHIAKEADEAFSVKNASLFLNGEPIPLQYVHIIPDALGFRVRVINGMSKMGAFSGKLNLVSDAGSEVGVDYFGFFK